LQQPHVLFCSDPGDRRSIFSGIINANPPENLDVFCAAIRDCFGEAFLALLRGVTADSDGYENASFVQSFFAN
jgi:hypothetical protein